MTNLLVECHDLLHLLGRGVEDERNTLHLGASGVLDGELEVESDVVLASSFGVDAVEM